jgi:hypothetical protein
VTDLRATVLLSTGDKLEGLIELSLYLIMHNIVL